MTCSFEDELGDAMAHAADSVFGMSDAALATLACDIADGAWELLAPKMWPENSGHVSQRAAGAACMAYQSMREMCDEFGDDNGDWDKMLAEALDHARRMLAIMHGFDAGRRTGERWASNLVGGIEGMLE